MLLLALLCAFASAYQNNQQSVLQNGDAGPHVKKVAVDVHFPKTLQVSVTSAKAAFGANEAVLVEVEIFNPGPGAAKFLSYFLPSESALDEHLLDVSLNGAPVEYVGPTFKRKGPSDEDYTKLKAGERVKGSLDLARYYDLSVTGQYSIEYRVESWNLFDERGPASNKVEGLSSEPLVLSIAGRARVSPDSPAALLDQGQGISFYSCSASRQTLINTAMNSAKVYTDNAKNAALSNSARYRTWFGDSFASYGSTIQSHYNKIRTGFNQNVVVDCSCTTSYYAYVYPASPYRIYVCNAFWSAPNTGTDSKAGTLIHEMSHFDIVANTNDYAYGQTACKNLASSVNSKWNADSHEYFAENTPPS